MKYTDYFKQYQDMFFKDLIPAHPGWTPRQPEQPNFSFTSFDADLFKKDNANSEITETGWKLEVEVPGFRQEQISVQIDKKDYFDTITIVAKSKTRSANFSYDLKQNVFDYEQYKMKLDLGVLTIEIPKIKDQNNPKKIELKF